MVTKNSKENMEVYTKTWKPTIEGRYSSTSISWWEELYSLRFAASRFSKARFGFRSTSQFYWRLYSSFIFTPIGHSLILSSPRWKWSTNTRQSYCYTYLLDLSVYGWIAYTSEIGLVCTLFSLFVEIWASICISCWKSSTKLTKRNSRNGKLKEMLRRKRARKREER